jgi:hypothetical protein
MTPNDTQPDTPKQTGEMEQILLAAYYRGKDKQGYSDTELKADVAALQALQDKKVAEALRRRMELDMTILNRKGE